MTTTKEGWYVLRTPYPGNYTIGNETISVSAEAVEAGTTIKRISTNGSSYWSFDEGTDNIAYDVYSANHGRLYGLNRESCSLSEMCLQFDGNRSEYMEAPIHSLNNFTISLWVQPDSLDSTGQNDYRVLLSSSESLALVLEENGRISFRVPGVTNELFVGGRVSVDEWTHVSAVYNGSHRSIYINGNEKAVDRVDPGSVDWETAILGTPGVKHSYDGRMDGLRIYDRALNQSAIHSVYNSTR
jgi:dolichyl-diphosphooligosaccharide--protein glycosyltransferase